MGLLYPLPTSEAEKDFLLVKYSDKKKAEEIELRSYGLPWLFWGYAFASIAVVVLLFVAVKEPLFKLIDLGNETDKVLAYMLLVLVCLIPLSIFGFLFYQKKIILNHQTLKLIHGTFFLPIYTRSYPVKTITHFSIEHFLDSPNLAKLRGEAENRAFENRGYYVLKLNRSHDSIMIDRHSQKNELEKIKSILENFLNLKTESN